MRLCTHSCLFSAFEQTDIPLWRRQNIRTASRAKSPKCVTVSKLREMMHAARARVHARCSQCMYWCVHQSPWHLKWSTSRGAIKIRQGCIHHWEKCWFRTSKFTWAGELCCSFSEHKPSHAQCSFESSFIKPLTDFPRAAVANLLLMHRGQSGMSQKDDMHASWGCKRFTTR